LLYIGLRDGRLLAIQVVDGAIRWSVETGNPIYASPLVHQGILYISSADGYMLSTPSMAWSVGAPVRKDGCIRLQLCWNDLVYVGSNDGALYLSIAAVASRAGTTAHHGRSGLPQLLARIGVLWR
jgi:outer membrane protein assembly factor BamB